MIYIRSYNESKSIKATDETIRKIVKNELKYFWNFGNLNHIDVSEVTSMRNLFGFLDQNHLPRRINISNWNVGSVVDMALMFCESKFNGDISNWNVQNVTNMSGMFWQSKFNGDISNWNVQNVTNMNTMFGYSKFNGDISRWNVENVQNTYYMFNKSPLEGKEPWWYILSYQFINIKSMYQSIEVYEWINIEKGIIWRKRLNYALQDFGKEDFKIPESISRFTIQ